jgi:sensor histidine kinase YesM
MHGAVLARNEWYPRNVCRQGTVHFEQSKLLATIQNFVHVSAYARPYVESIYVYIQNRADRLLTTTDGIVELSTLNDRQYRQKTLELLALQSQTNPRFLFNTLAPRKSTP